MSNATPQSQPVTPAAAPTLQETYQAALAELTTATAQLPSQALVFDAKDEEGMHLAERLAREEMQQGNAHYEELRTLTIQTNLLLSHWDGQEDPTAETIRHGIRAIIDYFDAKNGMIAIPLEAEGPKDRHLMVLHTMITTLLRKHLPNDHEGSAPRAMTAVMNDAVTRTQHLFGFQSELSSIRPTLKNASVVRKQLEEIYGRLLKKRQVGMSRRAILKNIGYMLGGATLLGSGSWLMSSDKESMVITDPKDVAPDDAEEMETFSKEFETEEIMGQRRVRIKIAKGYEFNESAVIRMATGPGKDLMRIVVAPDGTAAIPDSVGVNQTMYFTFWIRGKDGKYVDGAANNHFRNLQVKTPFVRSTGPTPAPAPAVK